MNEPLICRNCRQELHWTGFTSENHWVPDSHEDPGWWRCDPAPEPPEERSV